MILVIVVLAPACCALYKHTYLDRYVRGASQIQGVEGAGLVLWVGSPLGAFLGFALEKRSKARPTDKRYYTTRVVRH